MREYIFFKDRHLTGKTVMKKAAMAIITGVMLLALSSCGQAEEPEDARTNVTDGTAETDGGAGRVSETLSDDVAGSSDPDLSEMENLTGKYEYLSDLGTGRLAIEKTSYGYDISDYESESSYRFLADSSNIETIENNRIYIKYPEQVSSDGTAVFGYYILEYGADGIDVYYGNSSFKEAEFLYHAIKKAEAGASAGAYEYEGEYNSYDIDEPALEIKKNDDGTYQIQISFFRLWMLDDGIGRETEKGLEFSATGPGGNEMNGVIKLEGDIAAVTIFGQEWLDFAGLSEYRFYKTADVPDIDDFPADQQESDMQDAADAGSETAADELLDSFIDGRIKAVDPADPTWTFSVANLNTDAEEWNTYSVGEKADLDNDGENELVIKGPYGGIYLDARDGRVYQFAAAEGTALTLSYTCYNGAVWIMYSSRSSAGFECYHMEKYEGADHLVAEMNFGEEFDPNNAEAGIRYTWNESEISYDEYTALCSKILAAEVSTN